MRNVTGYIFLSEFTFTLFGLSDTGVAVLKLLNTSELCFYSKQLFLMFSAWLDHSHICCLFPYFQSFAEFWQWVFSLF